MLRISAEKIIRFNLFFLCHPRSFFFAIIFFIAVSVLVQCRSNNKIIPSSPYASLNDTVKYVGMDACRKCHQDKFETFMHTGMGMSFDRASQKKSSARFGEMEIIYDKHKDFYYYPYFRKDSLFVLEYRLSGKDTIHSRTEQVNYIVGSGQHTNSHIMNVNGYLYQAPATFYTQETRWDLPPGFENGNNSRFSRKIELECVSCHNAYPGMVDGSENKYEFIPNGIDCERCHGPGEQHVKDKTSGKLVDVSKEIDYSIVNPAKLPDELQLDICQRCHIQGNAVLNPGKSFFEFRPGMKLSEVMNVFMPRHSGENHKHIMASHAERLKMSQCFLVTNEKAEQQNSSSLFSAKQSLTCITCHNPHVSVKVTDKNIFNDACRSCHSSVASPSPQGEGVGLRECTEKPEARSQQQDNCVFCHMPRNHTTDIPHVTATDHFIRKSAKGRIRKGEPLKEETVSDIREFVGIFCINNSSPPQEAVADGYLSYYEKFTPNPLALDSAKKYLPDNSADDVRKNFSALVRWAFLKNDYRKVVKYVRQSGNDDSFFKKVKFNNDAAWTAYRIGESFNNLSANSKALKYYLLAVKLEPFNLEFRNKLGALQMSIGKEKEGGENFSFIYRENPEFVPALTNLGYYYLTVEKNPGKAEQFYKDALRLDPDNEQALLNRAGLYIFKKKIPEAKKLLEMILKKYPDNIQAKNALKQINS
ncbi:MAG TPA: tetratricopeptide repeat protein [Bacteroidia bacterium]|nr:tetratricopeptide repeat protein [Bacteroidia bacterium]